MSQNNNTISAEANNNTNIGNSNNNNNSNNSGNINNNSNIGDVQLSTLVLMNPLSFKFKDCWCGWSSPS